MGQEKQHNWSYCLKDFNSIIGDLVGMGAGLREYSKCILFVVLETLWGATINGREGSSRYAWSGPAMRVLRSNREMEMRGMEGNRRQEMEKNVCRSSFFSFFSVYLSHSVRLSSFSGGVFVSICM